MSTPNMNLQLPVVGVTDGPQYATDINNCLTIIDQHNHTAGSGVPITPAGLNINSDLSFISNNATDLRSARFSSQGSVLSLPSDLRCLYAVNADLYFNDGNGNQIRITQSGAVAGTPGSISNLISPASATYNTINATFVWQSAANTAANMDCGSITLRPIVANAKGLTLSPPSSIASDYTITLPSTPAANAVVTMDTSNNMVANTGAYLALPPAGSMMMFAGSSAPSGWLICNGQSVSTTTYAALFAVIGYTFGGSGGNFNVPNLVDRFPVGANNLYPRGSTGGEASHVLTIPELPAHSHTIQSSTTGISVTVPTLNTGGSANGANALGANGVNSSAVTIVNDPGHAHSADNTGSNAAHNNMPPYLAVNYIIKT